MRMPEPKLDMRADASIDGRSERERAGLLFGNVVADALAKPQEAVVFDYAVEAELRADV